MGGGFLIETAWFANGIAGLAPYTTTQWNWQQENAGAAGDASSFNNTTNSLALGSSLNGRVAAQWKVGWTSSASYSACNGLSGTVTVNYRGELVDVTCFEYGVNAEYRQPFTFSPNPFNLAAPPPSVTIQGSGFSATYGMPHVQYFDMNGNLAADQAASSVSEDGTTMTLVTPNFTEVSEGTYAGVISNMASDGSYQYVGTTSVDVPSPFYRPTSYSDMGINDPNDGWTQTNNPTGPITGGPLGSYTTTLTASDYWDITEGGDLEDLSSLAGACSWSGFPSHVDPNDLTLYIPYTLSVNGPATGANAGYFAVTVVINGNTTTLYSASSSSGTGVLTATIPAGTDLSTIQVNASVSPENWNPAGNPGTISDDISLDLYIE